jgi:hypothetical protein
MAVLAYISFLTSHRSPSDQIIQGGGLPTTPIILAVPPAKAGRSPGRRNRVLVPRISSLSPSTTITFPIAFGQGGGWQRKAQHQQV